MSGAIRNVLQSRRQPLTVKHTVLGSPRRKDAESFVRSAFKNRYQAEVSSFAPNLMLLEQGERTIAVTGWRCAGDERLFLECYLDAPIESAVARLAGQPVCRQKIVEVGNLAAEKAGGSIDVVLTLANHLNQLGYEWVVFTATRELIGIFRKLGLPLLALAPADPARLPEPVDDWGSYYDSAPIVVAGKVRLALERAQSHE